MAVREAEVLFKDSVAGSLIETPGGGTRFAYAPDWTAQIACSLPIERREHEWAVGLHPFFQHLAPEGWLREKQARAGNIAEEDEFGLLLRFGADCIGAVSLRSLTPLPPLQRPIRIDESPGRTVSGVQRKLLVTKRGGAFHAAAADGPAPFIAKFNARAEETLVRNEFLSLRWTQAALGKDEVTGFQLGQIEELNELALVVTRFDRTPAGGKLRLEDFAQILNKPRGLDYRGKYEAGYEDVAAVIAAHSARPQIDLDKFFRRLVVFALVGNCDAHLKNFSLLERDEGLRLAPVYDVVNTLTYPEYDRDLALSIDGRKLTMEAVTREVLRDFGVGIGLPARAVDLAFVDLKRDATRANDAVLPLHLQPDDFRDRFGEIVRNACLRILGE